MVLKPGRKYAEQVIQNCIRWPIQITPIFLCRSTSGDFLILRVNTLRIPWLCSRPCSYWAAPINPAQECGGTSNKLCNEEIYFIIFSLKGNSSRKSDSYYSRACADFAKGRDI